MYLKVQCCGAPKQLERTRTCIAENKLLRLTFQQKIKHRPDFGTPSDACSREVKILQLFPGFRGSFKLWKSEISIDQPVKNNNCCVCVCVPESHNWVMLVTQKSKEYNESLSSVSMCMDQADLLTRISQRFNNVNGPNYNYILSCNRNVTVADSRFLRGGGSIYYLGNFSPKNEWNWTEREARVPSGPLGPSNGTCPRPEATIPIACKMIFPWNTNLRTWLISCANSDTWLSI